MSREYRGERVVIYPAYIDSSLPRRLGRRVRAEEGVPRPTLKEIAQAAERLGLDPIVEPEARYPRTWFHQKGRVLVRKKASKTVLLRMIAREVASQRKARSRG